MIGKQTPSQDHLLDLEDFERQELIKMNFSNKEKFISILNISNHTIFMAKTTNINLENLSKEELIDLYREINIMSKINHPTILQFIGYSLLNFRKKEKPVIITEYASKLTLSNINSDEDDDEIILNLNDTQKLINIYGIAIGMSYLHSHNIIHRNLQLESIFLDEHFYLKISRFNYAKEIESNTTSFESRTDSKLKVKSNYVAPEVLTIIPNN